MQQPLEAVLIGAGNRGRLTFGGYAQQHPENLRFVAVAEPRAEQREWFARQHGIDPEHCFASADELYARGQIAPALINATMDRAHPATTIPALEQGYHVLLEKPMATTPHDCMRIVRAAESAGRILQIGHVLRFAPFFVAVKKAIASGRIGDIVNVDHKEHVAYYHMAHSYVRGNWGNLSRSSPMILSKCCHDMDLLRWIVDRPCLRVTSFGSLTHFRADAVGPEIPERCTDGCPIADECPYHAPHLYLSGDAPAWLVNPVSPNPTRETLLHALETGPYGRCVYRCDNDVVDHQVAIMEFEGDVTVTFTMQGLAYEGCRTVRYEGTRGALRGIEHPEALQVHPHRGDAQEVEIKHVEGGHGGGDTGLLNAFIDAVRNESAEVLTSARASLDSHLIAFAAESSRLERRVIEMVDFVQQIEEEVAADVSKL